MSMDLAGIESAFHAGGFAVVWGVLAAGIFVGLTPGAFLAGPAVLGYINLGVEQRRSSLIRRALAYVLGAAIPMAVFGLLVGYLGDVALVAVGEQIVLWYLLVALVLGVLGLLLAGLVVAPLPAYLPRPTPVVSSGGAFLLGLPMGLAACPACTPPLFPIATLAAVSGGPLYGAGLLFLFGLGRGVPILVAAASFGALQRLRWLIPVGLSAQRVSGWILLATSALYLVQVVLIVLRWPALFV
ncbi:MAG: sulfite exporter TauE/SafE family protein [Chloroflexi bacterium]|nr:sulfite exporter TauE/SafE family protein [Chloroflexota bacterium]